MIDPNTLKKTRETGLPMIAFRAARKPHSAEILFGTSDAKVYSADLSADKPEPVVFGEGVHSSYILGAALSGTTLLTGGYDRQLVWWNTETKEVIRKQPGHELWIRNIAVSPDGSFFVTVADDMHAKVWSAEDGRLVRTLDDHKPMTPQNYPSMLYAVAVSPDGKFIATGDKVGHAAIWDAATGEKAGEVEAPVMYTWDPRQRRHSIGGIRSLAFSPDSKLLAAGGIGTIGNIDHLGGPHRIEVFDWRKQERTFEISDEDHKGLVERLEFSPDGKWLAAAGGDNGGFVAFYDMSTGKAIKVDGAPMHVHDFAFNEDYTSLIAVGHHKLAAWELSAASAPDAPLVAPKPA